MFAPAFNIVNFKAKPLEIGNRHADIVEFGAGENIARDRSIFGPSFAEGLVVALGWPGDGVMQIKTIGLQQAIDRLEIGWMIVYSDMFEHADGSDLVEAAVDQRVVAQFERDAVLQTEARDFFLGIIVLLLRKRQTMRVHPVMLSGMADERAPTAADIQQGLTRLETKPTA